MARMLSALDRIALMALVTCSALAGLRVWMNENPQHDPWAPLSLSDPPGWATDRKLAALRGNVDQCRSFLERSGIASEALPPTGEGACRRPDRAILAATSPANVTLLPAGAEGTCAVDAAMAYWLRHGVQPAAETILGSRVVRIQHLGTVSCRRIGGGQEGNWSEHATGNAIDIAAFVLADGRRISVRQDWAGGGDEAAFLHMVRDAACQSFGTVLSPDYNAAHNDHFHLDQANRTAGWSVCR